MTEHQRPHSLMQADEHVLSWARQTLATENVSLMVPKRRTSENAVSLYLLELTDAPPLRGPGRAPLQVQARYLVTVHNDTPAAAHSQLNALLFAAMSHPLFETDFSISPTLWSALNLVPQPAFLLCVPVIVEQPLPATPVVREPPTIDGAPMMTLQGILLGPGDIPLANARVEYPSLQRVTTTNAQGEFHLRGLPVEPRTKQIQVHTKGKRFALTVEASQIASDTVVLHVPMLE